jgi:hypothetical protein
MTDLDALRARVGAATGPDRELDRDLAIYFGIWEPTKDFNKWKPAPALTASIDDALTLTERVLPGCWFRIDSAKSRRDEIKWRCEMADNRDWTWAPTAPLAILLALLAALPASSQEPTDVE